MSRLFLLSLLVLLGIFGALHPKTILYQAIFEESKSQVPVLPEIIISQTALFTGDIMLGRFVETLMRNNGSEYPFANFTDLKGSSTVVVVNFESSIAERHVQTPSGGFQFSTDTVFIPALARVGVTHASLANNHSLDYGPSGYINTSRILKDTNVTPFGHPSLVSKDSITYFALNDHKIAVIGIHTLFSKPNANDLQNTIKDAKENSDIQIAYVHWGTEYDLMHSQAQEQLAKLLVAEGVDAVIGHHPHVIQDIQLVDNVPVFYSLGNMIFDQYFSKEVEEGIALELSVSTSSLNFKLIPYDSKEVKSQPKALEGTKKETLLKDLALRSDPSLRRSIVESYVTVPLRP